MVMRKNIGRKVLLALFGLIAMAFYDTTMPLINGIIQLKINFLGFFLEALLQWSFDVSLRQAQTISAWIYLLIASFLFWYLLIRIYQALIASFCTAHRFWLALNRWQKVWFFFSVIVLFIVIGKAVLLFV